MGILLWSCLLAVNAPPALQWEIATAQGGVATGPLERLDARWNATIGGTAIKGDEIIAIRRSGTPIPPYPNAPQIGLRNGDRIRGECRLCTANEMQFRVQPGLDGAAKDDLPSLRLPRTALSVLWLRSFDANEMNLQHPWLRGVRKLDYILLANGDVLQGILDVIDPQAKELRLTRAGKTAVLALDRVQAIGFNTELSRTRLPQTAYGNLILRNGARLRVASMVLKEDQLVCETLLKGTLSIPLAEMAGCDLYQGKAVYLSDLQPAKYQYRPYLGEQYSWSADQNLQGGELRLPHPNGSTTADKGIALHSPCTIRYALDGKYRRLEASVGLDLDLGKRGDVDIRILVDEKDVTPAAVKTITGGDPARAVNINVENARELTLEIGMGKGGNVNDHANWGWARLIKK